MRPIISVGNLGVTRREPLLAGVTWELPEGRHAIILGPNGSGKTSLLRCLAGYLAPTTGTIEVCGQVFGRTDWRDLRKVIGLVSSAVSLQIGPSETALEVVCSGYDAVINLWSTPAEAQLAEARALLARLGLSYLRERRWEVLSQGERQRVLICRALITRRRILILDEPCAGLDPVARETFLRFISGLASQTESPTMLFVTHHLEEIPPEFEETLMLRRGSVFASGTTVSLIKSDTVSALFDARITVEWQAGRYYGRIQDVSAINSSE